MCLLVDLPEITQFRRTKDVDVVVEILTYPLSWLLFRVRLEKR
jgi:hypothetical protein